MALRAGQDVLMGVGRITVEYHAINNMAPPPAQNSCDYAIFAMYFWMPDQTHTKFSMHLHSERSRSKQLHVRHRALDAGWTLGAGYTSTPSPRQGAGNSAQGAGAQGAVHKTTPIAEHSPHGKASYMRTPPVFVALTIPPDHVLPQLTDSELVSVVSDYQYRAITAGIDTALPPGLQKEVQVRVQRAAQRFQQCDPGSVEQEAHE